MKFLNMVLNNVWLLFMRVLNKSNRMKMIFVFVVGFISRVFVNNVYNVNVFLDYLDQISLIYYLFFSLFIIIIHEFVDCFNNVFPSFSFINVIDNILISIVGFIVRLIKLINLRIFHYKLEDIKLSSLSSNKIFKTFITKNKVVLNINESENNDSGVESSN